MKKNLIYIQILLWAAIAIFGLCILGYSITTQIGSNRQEVFYGLELGLLGGNAYDLGEVENEFSIPCKNVDQIDLKLVSEDVVITAVDKENIEVIEYTTNSEDTHSPIKISTSGKTLRITKEREWNFFKFVRTKRTVEIKIPRKYVVKLKADLVSGDIRINEGSFDVLDLTTVSGKQEIQNINSNKIEQVSTSGELVSQLITCNKYKSDVVSGNTEVQFNQIPKEVDMETISGNIEVELPRENEGFELKYETVSGRVDSDFEVNWEKHEKTNGQGLYMKGTSVIQVKTVSGNIDIK